MNRRSLGRLRGENLDQLVRRECRVYQVRRSLKQADALGCELHEGGPVVEGDERGESEGAVPENPASANAVDRLVEKTSMIAKVLDHFGTTKALEIGSGRDQSEPRMPKNAPTEIGVARVANANRHVDVLRNEITIDVREINREFDRRVRFEKRREAVEEFALAKGERRGDMERTSRDSLL